MRRPLCILLWSVAPIALMYAWLGFTGPWLVPLLQQWEISVDLVCFGIFVLQMVAICIALALGFAGRLPGTSPPTSRRKETLT
jgi:hypothetical protein